MTIHKAAPVEAAMTTTRQGKISQYAFLYIQHFSPKDQDLMTQPRHAVAQPFKGAMTFKVSHRLCRESSLSKISPHYPTYSSPVDGRTFENIDGAARKDGFTAQKSKSGLLFMMRNARVKFSAGGSISFLPNHGGSSSNAR